jgi:hypothetical protein
MFEHVLFDFLKMQRINAFKWHIAHPQLRQELGLIQKSPWSLSFQTFSFKPPLHL